MRLNVKSLRVLHVYLLESSLRIVPMSAGFWLPRVTAASTGRLSEEFPAYGSVLLRLRAVNLRTVIVTAAVHRGFSSSLRTLRR